MSVPSSLPLDLKCKCVLAAIPLGCLDRVQSLFDEVCSSDPSDYGEIEFFNALRPEAAMIVSNPTPLKV